MMKIAVLILAIGISSCGRQSKVPALVSADSIAVENIKQPLVIPLIIKTSSIPGEIDTLAISGLNEPLRAIAAFYAAMGGSSCNGEECELTSALGLGRQGSEQHKKLLRDYFPGDKVAALLISQDCYLRPSGASTFSDYEYLTIRDAGDTVLIDYRLMYYNQGEVEWLEGPDSYLFRDQKFMKLKRNLWTHADKDSAN